MRNNTHQSSNRRQRAPRTGRPMPEVRSVSQSRSESESDDSGDVGLPPRREHEFESEMGRLLHPVTAPSDGRMPRRRKRTAADAFGAAPESDTDNEDAANAGGGGGGGTGGDGRANGQKRSRKENDRLTDAEDWVPVQAPSVFRIDQMLEAHGCDPHKCYFCRHVGYNLPHTTRSDLQRLVHTVNNMIEGADPVLTAQDAERVYASIRARSEKYRQDHEDSLPEMTATDILIHMRGSSRTQVRLPSGEAVTMSVLPHNRTPENSFGIIRDMLLETIMLHYNQGSIHRASADYLTAAGEPYVMLDKTQHKAWLDTIKVYRTICKDDPQEMHGYVPAQDRVVTNTPQGTLDTKNKRVIGLSALDTERNVEIVQAMRASFYRKIKDGKRPFT